MTRPCLRAQPRCFSTPPNCDLGMSVNCLSQSSMVSPSVGHSNLQWFFNGFNIQRPPPTLPPSPSPSPSPLPDRRRYHRPLPWPPPFAAAVPTRPLSLTSANAIVSRHHRRRRCHPASAAASAAALGLASLSQRGQPRQPIWSFWRHVQTGLLVSSAAALSAAIWARKGNAPLVLNL